MKALGKRKGVFVFLGIIVCAAFIYFVGMADDDSSPRVITTDPYSGESNVALNSNICATFSEPLDPSSVTSNTFTLADDFGNQIPGTVSYSNRTAVFIPFQHMDELTSYKATVSAQVRDMSGNSLGDDYTWSFRTAED